MIASKHRFHGLNSLNYVYRHGKTVRTKYFAAKYCQNKFRTDYRVSVVVSKKVSKSAPARNRIRRRLYELLRTEAGDKLPNLDIVITVFDEQVATIETKELKQHFHYMIKAILDSDKQSHNHRDMIY